MGKQLFDQYTLLHFAVGVVFYFWDISLFQSFVAHSIFEFAENTPMGMKFINQISGWPGGKPYADSFINNVGDTIGFVLGWIVAKWVDEFFKNSSET